MLHSIGCLFVYLFISCLFVFFVKGVKTYETHCTQLPRDRKRECVNNCSISFPLLEDPYLSWKENNRKIISNSGRVTNKKQTTHYNMIPGHLVSSKKICNERLHGPLTPNESYFQIPIPTYIVQDFLFGIGIWLWTVDNLGSSHHVSVVHERLPRLDHHWPIHFFQSTTLKASP